MTRRERILALCVAGTLGGVGLVKGVELAVVRPMLHTRDAIGAERVRGQKLDQRAIELADVRREWFDWTRRTLSDDRVVAQRLFREDIHRLLELHGLVNAKVTPGTFVADKNGFVTIPLTIQVKGTLRNVVGFMTDFYNRNYLARLDRVTLSADQSVIDAVNSTRAQHRAARGGTRGAGASPAAATPAGPGPDGPDLNINMTAVTLVLPKAEAEHPVVAEIGPLEEGAGRLPQPAAAYAEIFDTHLFRPYQPPEPAVVRGPTAETEPAPQPPAVVPRPPERPGADRMVLICTTSLYGRPVAYVRDERQPDQPPTQYRLDEPLDDGTLLLIHPLGLVVRVTKGGTHTDYFYRLGTTFAEREELDVQLHPDIWQAMQDEFLDWQPRPIDGAVGMR